MTGSGEAHGEGVRKKSRGGNRSRRTTRGRKVSRCRPGAATGEANNAGHGGRHRSAARGTERAAEAVGGWAWATSRWTELCARKGGGERV